MQLARHELSVAADLFRASGHIVESLPDTGRTIGLRFDSDKRVGSIVVWFFGRFNIETLTLADTDNPTEFYLDEEFTSIEQLRGALSRLLAITNPG